MVDRIYPTEIQLNNTIFFLIQSNCFVDLKLSISNSKETSATRYIGTRILRLLSLQNKKNNNKMHGVI